MSTNWSEDLISGYLDGELDPQLKSDVEMLLADDPAKAALLERLEQQRTLLRSLPEHRLKQDLSASIIRAAKELSVQPNHQKHRSRILSSVGGSRLPKKATSLIGNSGQGESSQQWHFAAGVLTTLVATILVVLFSLPFGTHHHPSGGRVAQLVGSEHDSDADSIGHDSVGLQVHIDLSSKSAATGDRDDADSPGSPGDQVVSNQQNEAEAAGGSQGVADDRQLKSSVADNDTSQPARIANHNSNAAAGASTPDGIVPPEANSGDERFAAAMKHHESVDQIVMVRLNPADIQQRILETTLDELKISLIGERDHSGIDTLFVNTNLASLKILLQRLGGHQKLSIISPSQEIGDTLFQGIDQHVFEVGVNHDVDSGNASSRSVPSIQDTDQVKADVALADNDPSRFEGTARLLSTIDLNVIDGPEMNSASMANQRPADSIDSNHKTEQDNVLDAVDGQPIIAREQSPFSPGDMRPLIEPPREDAADSKLANKGMSGVPEGETDQRPNSIGSSIGRRAATLQVDAADQSRQVRSLILIIADESVPVVSPSSKTDSVKDALPKMFDEGGSGAQPPLKPGTKAQSNDENKDR